MSDREKRRPESREETKTRLAWVMAATGYDPGAPGALHPHLFHPDGSVESPDGSWWWQAGEECALVSGMHTADELFDLAEHMSAVQRALWAVENEGAAPPPAPAVRSPFAPPAPITPRLRLARWLLHVGWRAVPEGPSRDMLRHLLRHWRRRWYAVPAASGP